MCKEKKWGFFPLGGFFDVIGKQREKKIFAKMV
jgi:hypothetical protein